MESSNKLFLLLALLVAAALAPVSSASAARPAQTRVIVTLPVPAAAPSVDQSAVISQATDALLALLPGDDYKVTNRYTVLPYVALVAGPATLAALKAARQGGLVVAIEHDVTVIAASDSKKCKTAQAAKKGKKSKATKKCAAQRLVH